MASRKSVRRAILVIVAIAGVVLAGRENRFATAFLLLFIVLCWYAFFKKSVCDVEGRNGRGCGKSARGRLLACDLPLHKRIKRDALFAAFGVQNPGKRFRIKWADPGESYGRISPTVTATPAQVTNNAYNVTMLLATVASALAAVAALFLPIV